MFETTGRIVQFGGRLVLDIPLTLRLYLPEVLRQAGRLVQSSAVVIWMLYIAIGAELGILAVFMFEPLGIKNYVALFVAPGSIQGASTELFCWILAAKVSCGYVAELGSMRISEEIDALKVMGVRPRAYLACTRLLAFWIVGLFIYWVGAAIFMAMGYFGSVVLMDAVSAGGFNDTFWSFQGPMDILKVSIWAMVSGTVVIVIGTYFGYTASGGPVGVGHATAKAMLYNMVAISVLAMLMFPALFGTLVSLPIAN
jgi:phospholipid/cholesterol/gamma-HCH transport system permease protein